MHILITGGFGFIGGRLAQKFLAGGHEVTIVSRTVRELPAWAKKARFIRINWNSMKALEESCLGVHVVIHAAGINAQQCFDDPINALRFNGLATAKLVSSAIKSNVKRFLYISTAHVYSNPLEGVISEETPTTNLHPYATSHLAGENFLLSADQQGKIDGLVLRLSNVFGLPAFNNGDCWYLLVNEICSQAVIDKKIVLKTNGLQYRNFISIAEVCNVVSDLIESELAIKGRKIFNLGCNNFSVLEVAKIVQQRSKALFNSEPKIHINMSDTNNGSLRSLEYQNIALANYGLKVKNDMEGAIDDLLISCKSRLKNVHSPLELLELNSKKI